MDKSSSTALFCFSFSHCFVSRFLEISLEEEDLGTYKLSELWGTLI